MDSLKKIENSEIYIKKKLQQTKLEDGEATLFLLLKTG